MGEFIRDEDGVYRQGRVETPREVEIPGRRPVTGLDKLNSHPKKKEKREQPEYCDECITRKKKKN